MNRAIEAHVTKHKRLEKVDKKRANHLSQVLADQVMEKAVQLAILTERKKAEEVLQLSEERYRKLFNSMDEGFALCEVILNENQVPFDYRFVEVNDAFEKETGLKRADVLGNTIKQVFFDFEPLWIESVGDIAIRGTSVRFESYNHNTRRHYEAIAFSPTKNQLGILLKDITERKKMQVELEEYARHLEDLVRERTEKLKEAERLIAIGETAGMVGHDIRNPLQAITGDVYLAKTELASTPESEEKKNALESLQEIEKNTDYINKIVADLQDFARPLKPNAEESDLKLIIEDLLKKNGLPENVKASVKVDSDARKVVADSTFINRIMYNLVTNAAQAMPKGGKLTIHAYKEASDVIITVKDTGVGIPEAVKGKLFTPMFTTKAKGQGFGLAVIKRMTEALGGTVSFESQEGKGTTFIIRLSLPKS
ncbi:MAG: ATP-binding protein [Candidatus Bathyarchaeia archaeon]|jgi:PAS domain S-box-containing protein